MTEDVKNRLKVITEKYLREFKKIAKDVDDIQILILAYDLTDLAEFRFSCEACAVEACDIFSRLHINAVHEKDKDSVH